MFNRIFRREPDAAIEELTALAAIEKKLREILAGRQKVRIVDDNFKPSAILIPIFVHQEEYHILFIRRTELVHYHKGQISFPGGGYHPEDGSLVNTALRESHEEIGLFPEDVEILGELDDMLTQSSYYCISPFVGLIKEDYGFSLSAFETAEVLDIPVQPLLDPRSVRPDGDFMLGGRCFTAYIFDFRDTHIHGATARILKQFLEIFSEAAAASRF